MIAGEQAYTVFKDTRELAKQTAKMVDAALKGQEVEINDTKTYDNGVKIVPSYLLVPQSVDINNYKQLLIDSGYLTEDQVGAAPAPVANPNAGALVGISMPTKSSARWISDGNNMVKAFEALGYKTDLQFAEDDIPNQVAQIENMVTKGAKVLVIAAIDGTTLSDILQKAKDAGHDGHGLRPPDLQDPERGLLRDLRQLPGRRDSGQPDRGSPRPERRQGPLQHRTVRRLARRHQRLLLL